MKRFFKWGILIGVVAGASAATLEEEFDAQPADSGWMLTGNTNLFVWNASEGRLEVTWDSSQSNSFCFLPLHTVLGTNDDFQLSFDLLLYDVQGGINPAKPSTFPLGLGLTRMSSAMRTNFFRGLGTSSGGPLNLVEFAYFPVADYIPQPTISPVCVSSNGFWQPTQFTSLYPLSPGSLYGVTMSYSAASATLTTQMTRDGMPFPVPSGTIQTVHLGTNFTDFRLDAFYIASYSDALQAGPTMFHGSLLAHGWVDRVHLTFPTPQRPQIAGQWNDGAWQVTFNSRLGWTYWLERSEDLATWVKVADTESGTGSPLMLADPNPTTVHALYRVATDRP